MNPRKVPQTAEFFHIEEHIACKNLLDQKKDVFVNKSMSDRLTIEQRHNNMAAEPEAERREK